MADRIRKVVEFDKDLLIRFQELYPATSMWWMLNLLLRAFLDEAEQDPPTAIAFRAVQKVKSGDV
jgi:hypothetical protein